MFVAAREQVGYDSPWRKPLAIRVFDNPVALVILTNSTANVFRPPLSSASTTMVAYDSRRLPDPDKMFSPETAAALVEAFRAQRTEGEAPIPALTEAVRNAAREARARRLPPEAVLIQLKLLAEQAGLTSTGDEDDRRRLREWMVTISLRAYWE
jgi:hypothetical protein